MKSTGVKKEASISESANFKSSDFVHLHNHTHYSVLDGLTKIPKLIKHVKNMGMDAVAMTDHGTLSGTVEFYKTATDEGIKPIIGIEAYIAARKHTDKEAQKDKPIYHLVILAMNNKGYENLMRLSAIAHLEGFYYKPRMDRNLLQKYSEGLIVLSGCIGSELGDALRNNRNKEAKETAEWYKSVFGDRYYLEVQDHGHQWDIQERVNKQIIKIGQELSIPVVVTGDAHYVEKSDQQAHELLLCVQTGSFYNDEDRMSLKDMDLFVEDPKDIAKRWKNNMAVITNTKAVADRCEVKLDLGKILIPKYQVPKGETEQSILRKKAWQGLAWRYGKVKEDQSQSLSEADAKKLLNKEVKQRAQFELETVGKMGFDGYYLIVADFVNWAKQREIVVGPGRGSAAGSIISYALKITDLDPLEYGLLFERFLNPERISMPDIDIDIQDNRRDEVIQYVIDKYGEDRVAHIVTFGKMAARNSIRDVARVLEVPYAEADHLAKLVPPPIQGRHIPLSISVKAESDLRNEYETNPTAKQVIDLATQLEGTIRSHGVHAAGVVIAPDEIVKYTPLEMAQKGVVATQYSMNPIEDIGLVKMDFLGLSNLTIIKNALRIIKKVHNKEIDISTISLKDKATYELLGSGDTSGIFQFESAGMKRYLKELKPEVFEDIIAMGALYRPGPLTAGLTEKFIARKNGKEKVSFEHELMKPALESTYGVLVYQEQVMRIARDMSGFSGGQADTLRKAIGKKNVGLMAKMKKEFVDGMVDNSKVKKSFAEKFWADLEGFADYAFNKSHSACYGLISYQTAYLKAHYPDAFMSALMTSNYDDTDRLAIMINECKSMGLEVTAPDINQSFLEFAVVPGTNKIRFGMIAIKNVGSGAVEEIIKARDKGGQFKSIEDFSNRVDTRIVNKKALESLIKAGLFDSLTKRDILLFNINNITNYSTKIHKERASGQTDLFGNSKNSHNIDQLMLDKPPNNTPESEQLQWERDLMGVYISNHPLDAYRNYLKEQTIGIKSISPDHDKQKVTVGGIITTLREISTRNGQKMAFVKIEDLEGDTELIIFPKIFNEIRDRLSPDAIIKAEGTISTKDRDGRSTQEIKVLVDKIDLIDIKIAKSYTPVGKRLAQIKTSNTTKVTKPKPISNNTNRLYIHIKDPENNEQLLAIKKVLNKHPGSTEAVLVLGEIRKSALKLPFRVDIKNGLQTELGKLLSQDCVAVK